MAIRHPLRNICLSSAIGTLIALVYSTTVFAGNNDAALSTAREIAKEGLTAYDAGRYAEAHEKLSRALEVVGVPTLALYTARANVKLGKLVRASELYLLATRLEPKGPSESVQMQAQRDAATERGELLPRIPRLTIVLQGEDLDGVEVLLDGQVVPKALLSTPQLVDPGHHKVAARRSADEVSAEVDIAELEHKTTTMRFVARDRGVPEDKVPTVETTTEIEPTLGGRGAEKSASLAQDSDSRSTLRTFGWIGVGVGGAGLALGAVSSGLALGLQNRLRDTGCNDRNACFADQQADVDRYNQMRTVSTIGFIAGGVVAAAGITLLVTLPKSERTRTALVLQPNSVALVGGF